MTDEIKKTGMDWEQLQQNLIGAVAVEVTLKGYASVKVNDQQVGLITRNNYPESVYGKAIAEMVKEIEDDVKHGS